MFTLTACAVALAAPATLLAQEARATEDTSEWCNEDRDRRARHCEVRELTFTAAALQIDDNANGSIAVQSWDRDEIQVLVKVSARADTRSDAESLVREVVVRSEDGELHADGPRTRDEERWSASYRIMAPRDTDLDLRSSNGSISVSEMSSQVRFRTSNGSVRLEGLGGDVRGSTSNGSVTVHLSGDSWQGDGMSVRTSNGSVKLYIPDNYSAHLKTGTSNGSLDIDFPVTVTGRITRSLDFDLGNGGRPVSVTTSNGSVKLMRAQ